MITAAKEWVEGGFVNKSYTRCVECHRNKDRIYNMKRRPAAERMFINCDEDWRILCRHMDERPEECFHANGKNKGKLKLGFLLGLLNKPGDTNKRLEAKMRRMRKRVVKASQSCDDCNAGTCLHADKTLGDAIDERSGTRRSFCEGLWAAAIE